MLLKKTESVIVLGVDSNYEEVTASAETYRTKYVYPKFKENGAEVRRLVGVTATRADFVREVHKPGVDYITGVGHGNYTTYTGHYGSPVLQVGNYSPDEVRNKVIHLLSCQTARTLGPDMVYNGAKAFLGYVDNFEFVMDCCDEFFECDSQIDWVMANGGTVSEAHNACIKKFDFFINKHNEAGEGRTAAVFEMDRDRLRSPSVSSEHYGDPNAKLDEGYVPPPPAKYYRVQVGAFRVQENALQMQAELKREGFDAVVRHEDDGLYRVQCGMFETKAEAIVLQKKLEQSGYQTVMKYY